MTREEAFERLNEVVQDVFDEEDLTVTDTTTAKDVEGWDSLEHINLINAIEQEFGMKFNSPSFPCVRPFPTRRRGV